MKEGKKKDEWLMRGLDEVTMLITWYKSREETY